MSRSFTLNEEDYFELLDIKLNVLLLLEPKSADHAILAITLVVHEAHSIHVQHLLLLSSPNGYV